MDLAELLAANTTCLRDLQIEHLNAADRNAKCPASRRTIKKLFIDKINKKLSGLATEVYGGVFVVYRD
jgi:hypothetical protein